MIRSKPFLVISILLSLALFQCKNAEKTSDNSQKETTDKYKKLAVEKLGDKVEYKSNQDGSLILCQTKIDLPKLTGVGVKFFVYDSKNDKIIFEDEIDKGTVNWYSNMQLAMFYTPGIMRTDQARDDYTFIYDLITKEKIRKSLLKN